MQFGRRERLLFSPLPHYFAQQQETEPTVPGYTLLPQLFLPSSSAKGFSGGQELPQLSCRVVVLAAATTEHFGPLHSLEISEGTVKKGDSTSCSCSLPVPQNLDKTQPIYYSKASLMAEKCPVQIHCHFWKRNAVG